MPKQRITADDLVRKMADTFRGGRETERRRLTVEPGSAGNQGGQPFVNPMTDEADLIVGGESGALTRLGVGTAGQVLTVQADLTLAWETPSAGTYTDEQAQDAIGGILTDSTSIDFTYDDALNTITAAVILEWLQDTVAAILTGGSHTNITTTYQDASGTIDLAATGGSYTDEQARDAIGAALVAGNNIDITVNDLADTITIDVESLTSGDVTDFTEAAQDAVGGALVDGTGINFTYNDGANTITAEPIFAGTGAAGTVARSDHTHGGGATITVQEGDVDVDTAVTTLDFDASDFNVASSPAGEANVSLNYGTGAGQPAEGNHTHAGATITVQEEDSTIVAAASTLDFAGTPFNVTDEGSGEARITLHPRLLEIASLTDPNEDQLVFWDDSADDLALLALGTNLSISGTTINAASGADVDPLLTRREMQTLKNPTATTASNVGFVSAATFTGTTASADDADGPWLSQATSGVSGNTAAHLNVSTIRRDWLPDIVLTLKTGADISSIRLWAGLVSGDPSGSATPAGVHLAAFRYDTGADGTAFWRAATNDTVSGYNVTTTTAAIAANTAYTLRIVCSASDVKFYVGGALVATHTTSLPGAATTLNYRIVITNLAASSRTFKWGRVAAWHE